MKKRKPVTVPYFRGERMYQNTTIGYVSIFYWSFDGFLTQLSPGASDKVAHTYTTHSTNQIGPEYEYLEELWIVK